MDRLIKAMTAEGEWLKVAARAVGGEIEFEPHSALSRDSGVPRTCHLVQAADGWLAVNLARDEDREAVPAWLGRELAGGDWVEIVRGRNCADLLAQAVLLGVPVGVVGEECRSLSGEGSVNRSALGMTLPTPTPLLKGRGLKALDLSALWAGPYCGGLLAEAGLTVTKGESHSRRDPTPITSPLLDRRLNGRKQRITLDLRGPELIERIGQSDILITSARPHALARLGLTEERLFALNPGLIWVAITAYGWTGDAAMRVGFGDDAAAAGGLITWQDGNPRFMGDALADPLTGLRAARLALEALAQGQCGLIDVALAPTAADFAWRAGIT
jgi:CoA-transferase family III